MSKVPALYHTDVNLTESEREQQHAHLQELTNSLVDVHKVPNVYLFSMEVIVMNDEDHYGIPWTIRFGTSK